MGVRLLIRKKRIKLPIYNNEIKIVLNTLNEFRNKIFKQRRYTEPVDELILKLIKHI